MKKLLGIVVISLFTSFAYAESLGTNKTVNDYVDNDYTIVSVVQDDGNFIYTLRSNAKSKPLVVTCIYSMTREITLCFKP